MANIEEVKEFQQVKIVEKKKPDYSEKIRVLAEKIYKESKENNETWITLNDESRDFWNSGDYLHFFLMKGRCKKLPEEISPILENALSKQNQLLREATEAEIKVECEKQATEELIGLGEIPAQKISEKKLRL